MDSIVLIIVIGMIIVFICDAARLYSKSKKYDELKPRLDKLDSYQRELFCEKEKFEHRVIAKEKEFKEDKEAIENIWKEKCKGFPWLAEAYADYFYLRKMKLSDYMKTKSHPAFVSAQKVAQIARERRIIEKKLRITQNIIKYYQNLFPFLEEFIGEIEEEILKSVLLRDIEKPIMDVSDLEVDPVKIYLSHLSKEDYDKLSTIERNQLALDRYWKRKKNSWELGKDYERYIGYLYESKGYNVYYQGILEGFDDLGRDLICTKNGETLIIQCKRWAQHKTIHEKHINQLFGTVIRYSIDKSDEKVKGIFCTTTALSDRAKDFAKYLSINVFEKFPLEKYPSIKCNVSHHNREKIYHLPFDQQYDRTIIENERNECYVESVEEAEKMGFRRAWKWRGET